MFQAFNCIGVLQRAHFARLIEPSRLQLFDVAHRGVEHEAQPSSTLLVRTDHPYPSRLQVRGEVQVMGGVLPIGGIVLHLDLPE
jgi:hypothetical protein